MRLYGRSNNDNTNQESWYSVALNYIWRRLRDMECATLGAVRNAVEYQSEAPHAGARPQEKINNERRFIFCWGKPQIKTINVLRQYLNPLQFKGQF